MKAKNLDDQYGTPVQDWAAVAARLNEGVLQAHDTGGPNRHTCWLTTINPDGSPHVTPVGAAWVDGTSGSRPAIAHGKRRTSRATRAAR